MKFKVNETFTGENLPEKEGPVLEFTRDELNLALKLNGITEAEARAFQNPGAFKLALFEQKNVIFLLVQIAGVIDWSDAPYSVVAFKKELWPASDPLARSVPMKLTAMLVEGTDKKVKAVRELTLDPEFAQGLLERIEAQKKETVAVQDYFKNIAAVQKKFPPQKMVDKAFATMGG